MKYQICIVTATRAEYGLLRPLIRRVQQDETLTLLLAVTGAHLEPRYGNTVEEIRKDNLPIDACLPILTEGDTQQDVSCVMANTITAFTAYFMERKPDMVVLLGDRYETLGVAIVALTCQIPICHIHGGETTEGAMDEAIRHSITKMSALHFTACAAYRKRVIQLGEQPDRVYNVGALGVENIRTLSLLTKEEAGAQIGFSLAEPYALITFHPVTLEQQTQGKQVQALFAALEQFPQLRLLFTKSNADSGGMEINALIDAYVDAHPQRAIAFSSMGYLRYLSAMQGCTMVLGNSSSGILEAPAFHVPTVDIGDRQKGRLAAASIIHCEAEQESIAAAIAQALSPAFLQLCSTVENPFGNGHTSEQIVSIMKGRLTEGISLKKKFYDVGFLV
ncbi:MULTISPECIES: UDP-N-acetylglucosamine 2-epimerase [unclassified Oscillibacter]|uniref:UDP-N-acetylglucosamine 2-epimerase n=1 Tax=unclassified Oscillibacter TaxID=2629304 RepID=UPI0025E97575|nr:MULTISPECIES: UDP-N-acetylglucosamine 2-epimerase [unclassified Oscillibacter]